MYLTKIVHLAVFEKLRDRRKFRKGIFGVSGLFNSPALEF